MADDGICLLRPRLSMIKPVANRSNVDGSGFTAAGVTMEARPFGYLTRADSDGNPVGKSSDIESAESSSHICVPPAARSRYSRSHTQPKFGDLQLTSVVFHMADRA
jgi:hypothetical protein